MPTVTLVLMFIGALGILISLVAFLYGLTGEEPPFDRLVIGTFIIGQVLVNVGIVYWLLV